jgi:hypothetical protein
MGSTKRYNFENSLACDRVKLSPGTAWTTWSVQTQYIFRTSWPLDIWTNLSCDRFSQKFTSMISIKLSKFNLYQELTSTVYQELNFAKVTLCQELTSIKSWPL